MITFLIPVSAVPADDEKFAEICRNNPESRVERTSKGDIIIMSPTGGETGRWNMKLGFYFESWNRQCKKGIFFDSSTAFVLPSSAIRSPDIAFLETDRWNSLSSENKSAFPPLCPDFILELKSKSDVLSVLQSKMTEWMENGCRLGWLIDMENKTYYIYRKNSAIEKIQGESAVLYGKDVLPDFKLSMADIYGL
ncbi:MAG TPA: Uma2 family endonuclease [Leptospiraceae bacterium]|nr:Uma2 family endonuclease [Leptospiraceae bacterium]HMZ60404.1 Uma2 family endonuclease [Leptospiraceae bacterium]